MRRIRINWKYQKDAGCETRCFFQVSPYGAGHILVPEAAQIMAGVDIYVRLCYINVIRFKTERTPTSQIIYICLDLAHCSHGALGYTYILIDWVTCISIYLYIHIFINLSICIVIYKCIWKGFKQTANIKKMQAAKPDVFFKFPPTALDPPSDYVWTSQKPHKLWLA